MSEKDFTGPSWIKNCSECWKAMRAQDVHFYGDETYLCDSCAEKLNAPAGEGEE